jgi:hypothetical protein
MNRQSDTVECLRGIIVADCIYRRNRNNHSMNRQSDTVECLRGIALPVHTVVAFVSSINTISHYYSSQTFYSIALPVHTVVVSVPSINTISHYYSSQIFYSIVLPVHTVVVSPQHEQAKRYCRMFERNNSG